MLTVLLHLVPRLKMCGAIPLLSLYTHTQPLLQQINWKHGSNLHVRREAYGGMEIQLHSLLICAGSVMPSRSTAKQQPNMRLGGPRWGLGLQGRATSILCLSQIKVCVCIYIYIYIHEYIHQQHKHFSTTAISGTGLSSSAEQQTSAVTLT
jgi:hypothetical protein